MVVIGFMGVVSQALAAWWWFQASCYEVSEDVQDVTREFRAIVRLNARAAIAQSLAAISAVILWLTGGNEQNSPPLPIRSMS